MALEDFLGVLRERWRILVLAVVLGAGAAATGWYALPKHYSSSMTFFVSAAPAATGGNAYNAALLSQQRVPSYVELVTSGQVAEAVITRLGLQEAPATLEKQLSATSAPQSVFIHVTVTGASPQEVTRIADAVGVVVPDAAAELERLDTPGGAPPVSVSVSQPAATPSASSGLGRSTAVALGAIAGLVVGLAGAFARNTLDRRVKSADRLRRAAGAATLGTIPFDRRARKGRVVVREDPRSPLSEAFRRLRTNLQLTGGAGRRQVVLVTSAGPAEGKTTTVCNLAAAVASAGSRVVVVDAELRRPGVATLLALQSSVGLTSVLSKKVTLDQALQQPYGSDAVDVLASGPLPVNPSEMLASPSMQALFDVLRDRYDVVLVDAPPLLAVTDAAVLAPSTDGVLLVCRYERTTSTEVESAVQSLEAVSAHLIGTVLTMAPRRGRSASGRYARRYMAARQPAGGPVGEEEWVPALRAEEEVRPATASGRPAPGLPQES